MAATAACWYTLCFVYSYITLWIRRDLESVSSNLLSDLLVTAWRPDILAPIGSRCRLLSDPALVLGVKCDAESVEQLARV